jgi:D-alanyl-D-alanine carboxypeptidase/D-alanyl-D-alanine-endopeptidase (penicillin-binding protein 4)
MRKLVLFLLLLLTSAVQGQILNGYETGAPAVVQEPRWVDQVRTRLDNMMSDRMLQSTQLGLMVYDLTANEVVYTLNERQRQRPASVMKLVTAITALDMLGEDYCYYTSFSYYGKIVGDTLRGSLYCVGGFDPTINQDDIRYMVNDIKRAGISNIEGMIVADLTMKDTLTYGSGWCWDDDNDRLTPLLVDKKDQFISVLLREMRSQGINLSVTLGKGKVPQRCTEIVRYRTGIDKVLSRMMKKSDNLYAESMFYQIARANSTNPGRASDASGAVKRLLYRLGLDPVNYTIADGSGLSLYSYVTAEMLVKLLRFAYDNRSIYNHLYPALPIAGVDGTLENRMKTAPCRNNVHAKTGTVSGVSTLAGYCQASNGHDLCFAILNQGVIKASDGRAFQDRICEALCR